MYHLSLARIVKEAWNTCVGARERMKQCSRIILMSCLSLAPQSYVCLEYMRWWLLSPFVHVYTHRPGPACHSRRGPRYALTLSALPVRRQGSLLSRLHRNHHGGPGIHELVAPVPIRAYTYA